jgi:4-diphosphocytidyl-2-C-methyl-D-erythritol kinase
MKLLAPGKVNLFLRVGKRRADGFHPLVSWFCTVGLFDVITIEPTTAFAFSMTCSDPALPSDERNLLFRAARGIGLAARAHLDKRIPMGAGLGGGSSDAGRMLFAARQALSPGRAERVAARLGSDVPFFASGAASAICSGRGEVVRPIAPPAAEWALLILPDIHVSTPAVYGKFDEMGLGDELREVDWAVMARLGARELMDGLFNDLEAAAFALEPRLQTLHSEVESELGRPVRMSGSGSAFFSLYDSEGAARAAGAGLGDVRTLVVRLCPAIDEDAEPSP